MRDSILNVNICFTAPPVFDKLSIAGKLEEGFPLTLTGKYSGGFEGASIIRWFRKDQWSDDSLEIEGATQKVIEFNWKGGI